MLLKENDSYTAYSYGLVSKQVMKFKEWYTVPPVRNGVAKLIPELIITPYGQLKNLLFRGSILKIKYRMVYGEIREYRLNILNTKSGIWVSPLSDSFELTGSEVEAIMLESDSTRYFKATFNANWINVPIKPQGSHHFS